MKKILFLVFMILSVIVIACAPPISEQETSSALAGWASKADVSTCYVDTVCRAAFQKCVQDQRCRTVQLNQKGSQRCIDECMQEALQGSSTLPATGQQQT